MQSTKFLYGLAQTAEASKDGEGERKQVPQHRHGMGEFAGMEGRHRKPEKADEEDGAN